MYLKKLQLGGFKSFAKPTTMEFPTRTTGIVGPNGSGKSNIKEAIQWVLGEQSVKSLRGKKGEDLIWNGSPQVPRMGRAAVELVFDNADGRIPMDFEEISIARKIFRDGMNEYYINESQVRLKDVVELMARIGLGESKHNIIGQGEVDRILLSSPRDRREMLEEALGLRVYQIKKNEAERKLEATENNMRQIEALVREIAPHLRFLRTQAQKAEARESIERELRELQRVYFAREFQEIQQEQQSVFARSAPLVDKRTQLKGEIDRLTSDIFEAEQELSQAMVKSEEEKKLADIEAKRRELERELGRLEGKLEVEREKLRQPKLRTVDMHYIRQEIQGSISSIRTLLEANHDPDVMRGRLHELAETLRILVENMERGSTEVAREDSEWEMMRNWEKAVQSLQSDLAEYNAQIKNWETVRTEARDRYRSLQVRVKSLDTTLRAKQDEERDVSLMLQRFSFDEDRVRARWDVFNREFPITGYTIADIQNISLEGNEMAPLEDVKRRIERMRVKLEEIGGIDTETLNEFKETEARHAFLAKELADLQSASGSLRKLIEELEQHVREDFQTGFAKIKDEFHKYFAIIFGGGKATLQMVTLNPGNRASEAEENEDDVREEADEVQKKEQGVDISVDLPRKRIKGLAMLSGGERALTSIALLFAITSVNPPPFLILDETDAALDEANTQRYANIIKELSKHTQLLLVTHNRETMRAADVLYGVTMGEDGVSKLLSLKFEQAERYTNR